jgi:glyoxylase-like metal-dependent hydrolase (beta-lactamase superfamily II)
VLHANVADGVHRISDSYTNWYVVEEDGRLTVVDAGVPSSWASLHDALGRLGRSASDIDAVVLTHAPRVVFSPGHTHGHCALHLSERGVLIAGDAIVMLDPYTGRRGPRLVARAATVDSDRNLRSLDALAATGAQTVLTGHGEPWTGGIEAAVAQARAAGAA